jgi:hypothetical protein
MTSIIIMATKDQKLLTSGEVGTSRGVCRRAMGLPTLQQTVLPVTLPLMIGGLGQAALILASNGMPCNLGWCWTLLFAALL